MQLTGISKILATWTAAAACCCFHTANAWADIRETECHEYDFSIGTGLVCASYEVYGPTWEMPEPVKDGEPTKAPTMVGNYEYYYTYQGLYQGLTSHVEWEESDDMTCRATVNGQQCNSCIRCDVDDSKDPIAVDCSNVHTPHGPGRVTDCEALRESFLPIEPDQVSTDPAGKYCYQTRDELKKDIDLYMAQLANPNIDLFDIETKGKIGTWCVSKITDFSWLFKNKEKFNEPLDGWDTSNAKDMAGMFYGAKSFNQPLNHFDVSKVTSMHRMFEDAIAFNQDLDLWKPVNLEYAKFMFQYAMSFNGDISTWSTPKLKETDSMFMHARSFNSDIGAWDVSQVTTMDGMFGYTYSFNQDLSLWETSRVTNMKALFQSAISFNSPLADWDTSKVTNMARMFRGASSFNQPVGDWDVRNVQDMNRMFDKASDFDQNLCDWELDFALTAEDVEYMFYNTDCPVDMDPVVGVPQTLYLCQPCASA